MFLLPAALVGCRGWYGQGPVPADVAASRRWTQESMALLQRGDVAAAADLARRAVESCPTDCEARRHLAEALWRRGDAAAAIEQLEDARRIGGEALLTVRAGEMYLATGRADVALARADEALDLDPFSADAWALRGRAQRQLGRGRDALYDLTRSLGLRPNDESTMRELAMLHLDLGQPQRALTVVESLVDRYGEDDVPYELADLRAHAQAAAARLEPASAATVAGGGRRAE